MERDGASESAASPHHLTLDPFLNSATAPQARFNIYIFLISRENKTHLSFSWYRVSFRCSDCPTRYIIRRFPLNRSPKMRTRLSGVPWNGAVLPRFLRNLLICKWIFGALWGRDEQLLMVDKYIKT